MSNVVRSAAVRLTMENASYIRGANQSAAVTEQATGRMQRAVRNTAVSTGRDWDTMGKYGGRTALVVGAGLAFAEKRIISFDKTMSAAGAATEATAKQQANLRAAAIKAGADTAFTSTEAAQAITEEAKAGISTANILKGGLTGALSLAAAGSIDVASAAEDMSTALVQFHLSGSQATHVADLLAAAANKAQGEVGDMSLALSYIGVPAHAAGISLEETVGTIALLAKNGLVGEKAGTSLRGMLASLQSPSKQASKVMKALGIDVYDSTGKFKGFDGVAQVLHNRLSGLTDQERQYALGKIFGNEQLQAANILYEQGARGVHKMTREVDDQGYATKVANEKLDNLAGDWERFTGSLEAVFIKAGTPAQAGLRDMTQGAEHLVNAFGQLPDEIQSSVVKLAVLATATGGILYAIAKVRNIARDIRGIGRGGGGAVGGLGRVASAASPVPVYVTNLGPGGLGGAPLGALGLGLSLGLAAVSAAGILDHPLKASDRPANRGNFVIDDEFLKTHVVVDGHWFTKTEWDKQKDASNDALLWLLSGGKKGAASGRGGKSPKALQDPLGPLFTHSSGAKTPKAKPISLASDIRGLADIFGKPGAGKATKNPVAKFEASLGLDTGAFDKKAAGARHTADDLDRLNIHPKVNLVGADAASAAIARVRAEMASIHDKSVRLTYYVNQINAANKGPAHGGKDGDPSTPYASGGYTGAGSKYDPAGVVHRREFVFSAEATDGNEQFLDSLHRRLRGYRDGGLVGTPTMVSGGPTTVDYNRWAAAAAGNQLLAHRSTREALLSAMRTALTEMPVQRVPRDLTYGMSS